VVTAKLVNVLINTDTVVGANMCVREPLEVKREENGGEGGVAEKEAYTVHTTKINSELLYFAACCLISCVDNVFGPCSYVRFISFYSQASGTGKAQKLLYYIV
jgi:hypothetical protein